MKLEHSFTVPVGIDEAWKILLDIERIGPCMPGAAIESVAGDDFTGSVKVKLGPIGLTYKGKASFVEKDEAAHRAVIDARGKDARGNGTASAKVTATLSERAGETHVQVDTDLDITGKPAQFGRGVMVDVGNKLIGQFADNLADEIGQDGAAPAAPVPEATAAAPAKKAAAKKAAAKKAAGRTPAQRPAPRRNAGAVEDDAPSTTDETPAAVDETPAAVDETPATTESAAAAPAAAASPAMLNGSSAAETPVAAPRRLPQRDVEPINLIESAGPAVVKRLAPVAAGLLLVLLFLWRRRRG